MMKFRPHAIKKLPMAQRAKRARTVVERSANAELAYELFGTYLLKHHKELVTGFLDKTGVEHDDGMIENLDSNAPAGDKVADVAKELDGNFDAELGEEMFLERVCVERGGGRLRSAVGQREGSQRSDHFIRAWRINPQCLTLPT